MESDEPCVWTLEEAPLPIRRLAEEWNCSGQIAYIPAYVYDDEGVPEWAAPGMFAPYTVELTMDQLRYDEADYTGAVIVGRDTELSGDDAARMRGYYGTGEDGEFAEIPRIGV